MGLKVLQKWMVGGRELGVSRTGVCREKQGGINQERTEKPFKTISNPTTHSTGSFFCFCFEKEEDRTNGLEQGWVSLWDLLFVLPERHSRPPGISHKTVAQGVEPVSIICRPPPTPHRAIHKDKITRHLTTDLGNRGRRFSMFQYPNLSQTALGNEDFLWLLSQLSEVDPSACPWPRRKLGSRTSCTFPISLFFTEVLSSDA